LCVRGEVGAGLTTLLECVSQAVRAVWCAR
jgi:hypothetical protein